MSDRTEDLSDLAPPNPEERRPAARPEHRTRRAGTIGARTGVAAAVAGGRFDPSNAANALQHGPTNGIAGEAANPLAHQATDAVGAEVVAAAAGAGGAAVAGAAAGGGGAVGAGAGTATAAGAASGAVAAGAGSGSAGGAAAGAAASQSPMMQAAAIGTVTIAAGAAVVVVVNDGDDQAPAAPPPTTVTTAAPEPAAPAPTPGPGLFETEATGSLDADLLAGVDQDTEAGPLMVSALGGEPTDVGVPVTLSSGATITIDPLGTFSYVPAETTTELGPGETVVDEFTYTVTNANGFIEEWTASVTVAGENDAPEFEPVTAVSTEEGETATVALTATDPDTGDTLTFTLGEDTPDFASLDDGGDGTAQLAIAPGDGDAGSHQVPVTVTDGGQPGLTATTTVSVTVIEVNQEFARVTGNLVALYNFGEGSGAAIGDSVGAGAPALTVGDPAAVTWDGGSLTVTGPTIVRSDGSAGALTDAIKASNEYTVEAWVTPANITQAGPARIVSLSEGLGLRNVSLTQGEPDGVGGDRWTSRQRSTATTDNGLPALVAPTGSAVEGRRTHLALTRSSDGTVTLYVDGRTASTANDGGDLSNWDGAFGLMLANETTMDRAWLGTFHLVAVYARALSEAEVDQNLQVGT